MLSITNNISVDELQYLFPIGKIQRERIVIKSKMRYLMYSHLNIV